MKFLTGHFGLLLGVLWRQSAELKAVVEKLLQKQSHHWSFGQSWLLRIGMMKKMKRTGLLMNCQSQMLMIDQ